MRIVHWRQLIACAVAATLLPSLALGAIERFACPHQAGWPVMTITVDTTAKTIEITPTGGLEPMEGSLEISATTFSWGFMRGGADLDRKTGRLSWDARAEYDYLDYIGQRPKEARETFVGRIQCKEI